MSAFSFVPSSEPRNLEDLIMETTEGDEAHQPLTLRPLDFPSVLEPWENEPEAGSSLMVEAASDGFRFFDLDDASDDIESLFIRLV